MFKYATIAEGQLFYNFVFYVVHGKTMYVYCPNCHTVHEFELTKKNTVKSVIENAKLCNCFDYMLRPEFKNAKYPLKGLNVSQWVGEFQRNESRGTVSFVGYLQLANFDENNYFADDDLGYVLCRHPIVSTKKFLEIEFFPDGKVSYSSNLKWNYNFFTYIKSPCIGEYWKNDKRWRQYYEFDPIEQSISELKGTFLEKYIPNMEEFNECMGGFLNMEIHPIDLTVLFLALIHSKTSIKNLWKHGFQTLVVNEVFRASGYKGSVNYYGVSVDIHNSIGTLNLRGKDVGKILKCNIDNLVNACGSREDIRVADVAAVQRLEQYGIPTTSENVVIAKHCQDIMLLWSHRQIDLPKTFKYLRNQAHRHLIPLEMLGRDYHDYLNALSELKTELTNQVLFPSNFTAAHDRATAQVKYVKNAQKEKAFREATKKWRLCNLDSKEYDIRVIDSVQKLCFEAARMHNCSGGYVDKIARGSAVIFVIKEKAKPRTPFGMLELDPRELRIVQCRGVRNRTISDERLKAFLDKWLQRLASPQILKQVVNWT